MDLIFLIVILSLTGLLAFLSAPLFVWAVALVLIALYLQVHLVYFVLLFLFIFFIAIPSVRVRTITPLLIWLIKKFKIFPRISETERVALEAGVNWVETEFFSGRPRFKNLHGAPSVSLTQEEQNFLDNEVETLCSMIDDWKIHKTRIIPKEVDDYIRSKKFLGMIIPKSYGGLGFSHLAHARILEKVCSKSYAVGIYVMVPNSLGPGELLIHYGTKKQKEYYLPRLADGREIPCFGLTEPRAGSDAASIESKGVLFKDQDGHLKIRIQWNKRWITLASVSTLLGIAFKLEDPEEILGRGKNIGITCALIPSNSAGVELGRRHDPMGIAFPNCPIEGRDVLISAEENIIGGLQQAGRGWAMLMDCLGTGRGISLPSSALASCKLLTRVVSHHSVARRQFGLPIGRFEGVQEKLALMGGFTFLSQSMLNYTLSALSHNIPSALCSAMTKYQLTEIGRKVAAYGMDIMGGAGLSMGPKNLTALSYIAAPISITVEGANILTRSFIIFGQGIIRAHPFVYKEIKALENNQTRDFDSHFWSHAGHVITGLIRCFFLHITRGIFVFVPGWKGRGLRYQQKIYWASSLFSVLSDMAMVSLGGRLKIKERITGRFADALMGLYMASAVLWNWKINGRKKSQWPFVKWSVNYSLNLTQKSFEDLLRNFDVPVVSWLLSYGVFYLIRWNPLTLLTKDSLSSEIAQEMINHPEVLDDLTKGIYKPNNQDSRMKQLEDAYTLSIEARPIEDKIKKAVKQGKLERKRLHQLIHVALKNHVITSKEYDKLVHLEKIRWEAIQVDSFSQEEYLAR